MKIYNRILPHHCTCNMNPSIQYMLCSIINYKIDLAIPTATVFLIIKNYYFVTDDCAQNA